MYFEANIFHKIFDRLFYCHVELELAELVCLKIGKVAPIRLLHSKPANGQLVRFV